MSAYRADILWACVGTLMALSWFVDVAERYAFVIAFSIMVGLGCAGLRPRKFTRWAIAGCALIGSIGCFGRLETPFPLSLDPFSVGESEAITYLLAIALLGFSVALVRDERNAASIAGAIDNGPVNGDR